jgi:hypothetical protein
MTSNPTKQQLSRRSTIAALTGAGLGIALASTRTVGAQETDLASHPIVGTWLVRTPDGALGVSHMSADGTWTHGGALFGPPGPDGAITFMSEQNGVWEPDPENERGIHFVSVQGMFDASGAYIGTRIIDGYPVVSEDGQTILDDWSKSNFTIRDANDEVVEVIHPGETGAPPIAGVRLTPGELVFPPLHAPAATPEG